MDYSNYRCPVCEKPFVNDSEIVVCPECGAPHHRECYETLNHCFYEDKHKDDFDFKAEYSASKPNDTKNQSNVHNHSGHSSDIICCQTCGTFNISSNDFCTNCGAPIEHKSNTAGYSPYDRHNQEKQTPPPERNTNPQQPFAGFAFDPMGGLKPDEDLGAGVTVGEVSKFTKNNSPFFCRLFHQIKNLGRSRFSFVGFIFHGGWLLYRKMYKIGALITGIMALLIISQLYIDHFYADLMKEFAKITENINYTSATETLGTFLSSLDNEELTAMIIYAASSICQLVLRIICALCGNRWYYKHTIKTISKIKNNPGTDKGTDDSIEAKGGVNGSLATSLIITYMVLTFLPTFF